MRVRLIDPMGFNHIVEFHEGKVYGAENIAHMFSDKETRQLVRDRYVRFMTESRGGDIDGYRWERIDDRVS